MGFRRHIASRMASRMASWMTSWMTSWAIGLAASAAAFPAARYAAAQCDPTVACTTAAAALFVGDLNADERVNSADLQVFQDQQPARRAQSGHPLLQQSGARVVSDAGACL